MKALAAFSTFALYCAALWSLSLLPAQLGEFVVQVLATLPGLALILWRAGAFDRERRGADDAPRRLFTRIGWSGTFWLGVAMTINAVAVSELAALEALPARLALAALVLGVGVGLSALAWVRAGARPHRAGQPSRGG